MENNNLTFETAVARIDEITAMLAGGVVPLEESIELYREASGLLVAAKTLLENAELKVEEITLTLEKETPMVEEEA